MKIILLLVFSVVKEHYEDRIISKCVQSLSPNAINV